MTRKDAGAAYRLVDFVPAHLPELTDLWVEAWMKTMPAIDFEARRTWFVDRLSEMRRQGATVTCAFDAATGAMAGFVTLDAESVHIDQLAVAPAYWSKGAANALLDHAKRQSHGALRLDVNQNNPRAVRFYEREDFHRRTAAANPMSGMKTWRYEWSGDLTRTSARGPDTSSDRARRR